jgi:hypothetical protein
MKLVPAAPDASPTAGDAHAHTHDTADGLEWEDLMPEINRASDSSNMIWKLVDRDTGKANWEIDWAFRVGDRVKIRSGQRHGSGPSDAPSLPCPRRGTVALYPGFTALDIIGPFQVLADVPGHELVFVAGDSGPVIDHTGRCSLIATAAFPEVTAPDSGRRTLRRLGRPSRAVAPSGASHHDMDHQRVHRRSLSRGRGHSRGARRDHTLGSGRTA